MTAKTPEELRQEDLDMYEKLRERGYAVCVFTPEELGPANVHDVEEAMCKAGWDCISVWEWNDENP